MNGTTLIRLLPGLLLSLMLMAFISGCGSPSSPYGGGDTSPTSYYDVKGHYSTRGWAMDMDLEGDTLYVAERSGGVGIYDASDPTNLVLSRVLHTGDRAQMVNAIPEVNAIVVALSDINIIYFLDSLENDLSTTFGSGGVTEILSFALEDSATSRNFTDAPWALVDVARTLVCDGSDGIQVFNVYLDSTDKIVFPVDTLRVMSWDERMTLNWPGVAEAGVAVMEDIYTVAVGLKDYGVGFADISDAVEEEDGIWLSDIDTPGEAQGLVYEDGYVYVADGIGGLSVIDATNITTPELVATWKIDGLDHAFRVEINEHRLAVIDEFDGVYFLDVSDPSDPVLMDWIELRNPTDLIFVDEGLAIISSELDGLTTVRLLY